MSSEEKSNTSREPTTSKAVHHDATVETPASGTRAFDGSEIYDGSKKYDAGGTDSGPTAES